MTKAEKALVKETKTLIKEVEAGDSLRAAWIAIQERVARLYEGRTQAEVGEVLGKSGAWVSRVLSWDSVAATSPNVQLEAGRSTTQAERGAQQVLRDPAQRKKVIESLDSDTRDALLKDTWEKQDEEPALSPQAERTYQHKSDEKKAREQLQKAIWAIRARIEFYSDFPLTEHERTDIQILRTLVDRLEAGAGMDAELEELIANAS